MKSAARSPPECSCPTIFEFLYLIKSFQMDDCSLLKYSSNSYLLQMQMRLNCRVSIGLHCRRSTPC